MLKYICPECKKSGLHQVLVYDPAIRKFKCPLMRCTFIDRRFGNSVITEDVDRRGTYKHDQIEPWENVVDFEFKFD